MSDDGSGRDRGDAEPKVKSEVTLRLKDLTTTILRKARNACTEEVNLSGEETERTDSFVCALFLRVQAGGQTSLLPGHGRAAGDAGRGNPAKRKRRMG